MRNIGPMRNPGMGPLFMQANRNKRSLRLDLKDPEDLKHLERLLTDADVFISNIRPRALARLGLAYDDVRKLNPSIVFCSCVGYGQNGPLAAEAVYDDLMQAASGVSGMFERVDGKPRYAPVNICDRVVGLYAAVAVQAALFHRARTGEGQSVEVPMFETMADFVLITLAVWPSCLRLVPRATFACSRANAAPTPPAMDTLRSWSTRMRTGSGLRKSWASRRSSPILALPACKRDRRTPRRRAACSPRNSHGAAPPNGWRFCARPTSRPAA
jgi:hypothetical protein